MEKLQALLKYIVSEMVKTQEAIDITYETKKDLITKDYIVSLLVS